MISAVLFDAGEVLYTRPRREQTIRTYLESLGLSDELDRGGREAARELKVRSWLGEITPDEYHREMLRVYGVTRTADLDRGSQLWESVWPDIELFPGVPDTLRQLKARGVKLGVVTNTLNRTLEKLAWFRRLGMPEDLWDAFATSAELGVVKPDPRIYGYALDQLGLEANAAVFVGHAQLELDGAASIGMGTVAFNRDDETVTAGTVIDDFGSLLDIVGARTGGR